MDLLASPPVRPASRRCEAERSLGLTTRVRRLWFSKRTRGAARFRVRGLGALGLYEHRLEPACESGRQPPPATNGVLNGNRVTRAALICSSAIHWIGETNTDLLHPGSGSDGRRPVLSVTRIRHLGRL